jgi:threonylcarbamoyladenosine tRNA methylthiotransferase CDKAL1
VVYKNSFFIETYGCTFNQADENCLKSTLINNNYVPCSIEHAEYVIINTCAVKSQTQDKIISRIKTIQLQSDQNLIISGCLPWISDDLLNEIIKSSKKIIAIIDLDSIVLIHEIIKQYREEKKIVIKKSEVKIDKAKISPWIDNLNDSGIVPICEGCNKNCSFCCTKISRGHLYSYNLNFIVEQIKSFLNKGIKEILLTSQDCGYYKWESVDLCDLLSQLNAQFSNYHVFVRIGMMDPSYLIDRIENVSKQIIESKIFYKFLHVPIQCASNSILKKMHRIYLKDQIYDIFQTLRRLNLTISTDIICGFPTETDEDFNDTVNFIKKFNPDIINISKFTARPNTEAKKLKQLDSEIIKSRTENLTKIYDEYSVENNKKWLNWEGSILINKFEPNKEFPYSGRNQYFKPVALKNGKVNNFYTIKIVDTKSTYLIGEIIDN